MPTGINPGPIIQYSSGVIGVINGILVPVLIAIAFIVFLWGIYKYFIYGADNESEKGEGRKFAIWGIIGFVIILSLWGLVNLVMGTLGLSVGQAPPFPTIGGQTGVTRGSQYFTPTNIGTVGGTGSNVFGSNGSLLGSVSSNGQIVNNGQVVGRMINGEPYYTSGTRIVGSTVSNGGSSSTNTTPEGYDFTDIPIPEGTTQTDAEFVDEECVDEEGNPC